MVGIELVWNVRDGSDPEILFIRNTSPQIFILVNFDLFFYSHQTKNVGHLQNTICYTFFDETIAENQKADEPTRTYCTTQATLLRAMWQPG